MKKTLNDFSGFVGYLPLGRRRVFVNNAINDGWGRDGLNYAYFVTSPLRLDHLRGNCGEEEVRRCFDIIAACSIYLASMETETKAESKPIEIPKKPMTVEGLIDLLKTYDQKAQARLLGYSYGPGEIEMDFRITLKV